MGIIYPPMTSSVDLSSLLSSIAWLILQNSSSPCKDICISLIFDQAAVFDCRQIRYSLAPSKYHSRVNRRSSARCSEAAAGLTQNFSEILALIVIHVL